MTRHDMAFDYEPFDLERFSTFELMFAVKGADAMLLYLSWRSAARSTGVSMPSCSTLWLPNTTTIRLLIG